jgi:GNAT superfamily N-acetyltransferase
MTIQIRDASVEDAQALVPLFDTLGYPATLEVVQRRMEELLRDDPGARVIVAVRGQRIIGMATLHVTPVLHRPTAVARVTALAVAPDAQGSGAGRALMEAAERHFREAGYQRIEVTSGPTHAPAHEFYRRLGYQDQGVRFSKPLGP